ncbi:hypothetical protein LI328DRAFT_160010 [Trichoderma asperelloides]|nr:hypothetical protein LI328DRAFT_160010 [Trichoderma asperelloides]
MCFCPIASLGARSTLLLACHFHRYNIQTLLAPSCFFRANARYRIRRGVQHPGSWSFLLFGTLELRSCLGRPLLCFAGTHLDGILLTSLFLHFVLPHHPPATWYTTWLGTWVSEETTLSTSTPPRYKTR